MRACDVEPGARELVPQLDRLDAAFAHDEARGLDMVGADGAEGGSALDEGQDEAGGVVHLPVAEDAGSGQALGRQARESVA